MAGAAPGQSARDVCFDRGRLPDPRPGHHRHLGVRRRPLGVDAASGRPTAWNPSANSALGVFSLAPVPGGPLVAGGDFTQVGGAANRHLALFG